MSDDYHVSLFDKSGVRLAEIDAGFHCIWTLNKVAKADFVLAISDPKCTESNLQVGNFVVFEHDRLGSWGGVIAPHDRREWTGDGTVTIRVLSAEMQFGRRRGPANQLFRGTAGSIYRQFIAWGNGQADMLVREGAIWMGGATHEETSRDDILLEAWQRVAERSSVDWWFEPSIGSDGKLVFLAHLADLRGQDVGYALLEGINIETPAGTFMIEGGRAIENDMAISGEGATVESRPRGTAKNQSSIDLYGLWQGSDTSEATTPETLTSQAQEHVNTLGFPQKRFKITAIESPERTDTFAHIGMGDVIALRLSSVGFYAGEIGYEGNVRIVSREYDTNIDKVILVQEEV